MMSRSRTGSRRMEMGAGATVSSMEPIQPIQNENNEILEPYQTDKHRDHNKKAQEHRDKAEENPRAGSAKDIFPWKL